MCNALCGQDSVSTEVVSMDYNLVRYSIVPPVFLLFFTLITQWLVCAGSSSKTFSLSSFLNTGTVFSWTVVLVFLAWSFLSLKVPSKVFKGPATPVGYVPLYSANGTQYYLVSLVAYLALVWCLPSLPLDIWRHFDYISLALCAFFLFKGE